MKKIIFSFFIVSIVLINAITLDEYVELALKNSNEFRLARIEFLQSEMALKIAHGGFLPEVNFTLKGPDYSWNRNYINFLGYANRMELIAETNNLSGGLDISQSLPFSGNLRISNGLKKYSSDYNLYNNVKEYDLYTNINLLFPILEEDTTKKNIKRKKVEYEIAKNNYEQKLKSIKKEAITLYTEAQMNKVKENIAKEELENSKKLYSITKDKLDIGTASEIDLLDNDILVSQKEIMLNEAKNNRLSAVKKMGDYVNTTNEINVEIGQIELFQKKIPQYENLVNTALKNDQTINNYQITLRELKSELHYLVFRQYFSASIGAGYNFDGRGDSVSDTFNDYKKSNWYGYLLLNIPIFDASVKALNVTIKKTAIKKTKLELENYRKEIKNSLFDLYQTNIILIERVGLLKKQLEKSKKLFEMTKLRYENGFESYEKIKEVEIDYENTRLNLSNTIYQLNKNYLEILYYSGD